MDDHHHDQTPGPGDEPALDAATGRIEAHCSACGASIEGSDEFCRVCAVEAGGGEEEPAGGETS